LETKYTDFWRFATSPLPIKVRTFHETRAGRAGIGMAPCGMRSGKRAERALYGQMKGMHS
jgi:hypothetical protein